MKMQVAKSDAIIASNTSSISITKLAAAAGEGRQSSFVGMHELVGLVAMYTRIESKYM